MIDLPEAGPNEAMLTGPETQLLDVLPVAVYICRADGTIVRANKTAIELWGRSPKVGDDEDRFCGAHKLFLPDGRVLPKADTPMAEALRSGRSCRQQEVHIERQDGTRIIVRVNIDPILDDEGRIVGAVNCFQDVTEQERAKQVIVQRDQFLSAIIETTPECVKLVAEDGTLLEMNAAGLQMVEAASAEEVLGRDTHELIAPEYKDEWRSLHKRVCSGERLSWEFDIIGLGGSRRNMETHAAPIQLPNGSFAQLAITRDITERKKNERALRESETNLSNLLQALPSAIYTTDQHGIVRFYNQAAVEVSGRIPQIGSDRWSIAWRLYNPEGTLLPHEECPMAVALKENRQIHGAEIVAERPDGSKVPLLVYPTPLWDSAGNLTGAVNVMIDITERKKADEHRQLLINELNHRVKNTLAAVQSIAFQTLDRKGHKEKQFEARLLSLARTHDVLTKRNWEFAHFSEIVELAIAPSGGVNGGRFNLSGPEIELPPRAALSLALALHELSTNAMKYGALSNDQGIVEIDWSQIDGGERFQLTWVERGGPPVARPEHRGFGSRLLERSLQAEIGASVQLNYDTAGVTCEIVAGLTHAE
ncbi:PAS domain S-box protein [Pelagibacterium sp. H642]|uniref:PAS domain-containing sensor histidine kinase n=1 Tax=Pelagibacterium sp. H642 TaxID=1881069 RepID=UPI0028161CAF|nr:PAS domain S-box protein [Pelagibacterium sp. H642]WMT92594.1 PAS domain S-box protein [Pelagibacterium sp. H642]